MRAGELTKTPPWVQRQIPLINVCKGPISTSVWIDDGSEPTYCTKATVTRMGTVAHTVPCTTVCRFIKPPEVSLRGETLVVPEASSGAAETVRRRAKAAKRVKRYPVSRMVDLLRNSSMESCPVVVRALGGEGRGWRECGTTQAQVDGRRTNGSTWESASLSRETYYIP